MTEADEVRAREALAVAEAACKRWAGREGDDRDVDLASALEALTEARGPLSAHCRTGSRVGRSVSTDPLRVLNREVADALKWLRDLRTSHPGTHPTRERKRAGTNGDQLRRHLRWSKQEGTKVRAEHEALRRTLASARFDQPELRAEAVGLLARIDKRVGQTSRRWQEYAGDQPDRLARARYNGQHAYDVTTADDALYVRVKRTRRAWAKLRADVAESSRQTRPERPQNGSHVAGHAWDPEQVTNAWIAFRDRKGRWPTKTDHARDETLPGYAQLRRTIGESPITTIRNVLS